MILSRTIGKSCAANGADAAFYKINLVIAKGAEHLTGKRMQNFRAARTLGRKNNFT
jgi:hypothetical protein